MPDLVAIGVDPGFAESGISVVKRVGGKFEIMTSIVITSKKDRDKIRQGVRIVEDNVRRIGEIVGGINDCCNKFLPTIAGIESFSVRPGSNMGWKTAFGFSAAVSVFYMRGIPVYTYTPMDVKKAISGNKSADKKKVFEDLRDKFFPSGIKVSVPKSRLEHIGDSLSLAVMAILERDRIVRQLGL